MKSRSLTIRPRDCPLHTPCTLHMGINLSQIGPYSPITSFCLFSTFGLSHVRSQTFVDFPARHRKNSTYSGNLGA